MQILHGTWLSDEKSFVLWGEDCSVIPKVKSKSKHHPFQTSLEFCLQIVLNNDDFADPESLKALIWLPSHNGQAQASPQALASGASSLESVSELAGWKLELLRLNFEDALNFLLGIGTQASNYQLGQDLLFWKQAALLLMNCLLEGRYIPALEQQGWQYRAFWKARPDIVLSQKLSAAMPPLCRAIAKTIEAAPQAEDLLENFLSFGIDTLIRRLYESKKIPNHFWLKALCSSDNILKADNTAARSLYHEWEKWQAVAAWAGGSFRICLRLSEPDFDSDSWRLDYLLQANDDSSLLVEAKEVWETKGQSLQYLERRFEQPKEKLLAALGMASRLFVPIERSLRTARPSGENLSHEEAYQFLAEALSLLESMGFSVLVPNWWGQKARLRAKGKVKGQANNPSGFLTKESLLSYEWQLSLGDESISQEEFENLVALKQPLVRFKGKWVSLDPEQIEAALKFFAEGDSQISLMDFLKRNSQVAESEIAVGEIEWAGDLAQSMERLYQPELALLPPKPKNLQASLRPYQERGYAWLWQMRQMRLGACLADDMGLGKTLQTISLWLYERETSHLTAPALVVCPTSVVGNWKHEIRKFAPNLRIMLHQGKERMQDVAAFQRELEAVDVVLTSYALLRRDSELFESITWSDVILDEAQNIKNPSTKQAQVARKLSAEFKLALTGTPVENRLTELWSIMQFLNEGYLGSQQSFKSNFANPIERYSDQNARENLRQLTAPFILRRMKSDPKIIQDLPEKFENKVYCSLSSEQATLYEAEVREALESIEDAEDEMSRRGNVLRMLTRLKQICNHPAHFLKQGSDKLDARSGKLERLAEMLEEVRDNGEAALIFTQYAEMGFLLQDYLKARFMDEVFFLHGGTPAKDRETMVRRFQAPHGPRIFILSLKAGGTGLTLTAANHVFHFDRWYNPAVENQATDRAFRIGQSKNVQVHKYICLGTLEERIDEMIEHKQSLAESVLGAGENWISELSNQALRDLVSLRHEIVEEF